VLTVGSASLSAWELPELRRDLAPVVTFTKRYHDGHYCLSTLPVEVGARVESFFEPELSLPAYLVAAPGQSIIRVNNRLDGSPLHPVSLLHECSHFLLGHRHLRCTGKVESRGERDVWLASALVSVSRQLATLVIDGRADVSEIADRCRVPEPLVMVRLGMMYVLGEKRGHVGEALDTIRYWLRRLEDWIQAARAGLLWQQLA